MTISDKNHDDYSRHDAEELKGKMYIQKKTSNIPPTLFSERTQEPELFGQDPSVVIITDVDDNRPSSSSKNNKKNKVRRKGSRKTSSPQFDITTLGLKEEQINDIKIATRRIKTYIRTYIKYYWPPKEVGIFRVSPGHAMNRSLEKETEGLHGSALRRVLTQKAENDKDFNPYFLASVIKKTLRELSTPAIPAVLYKQFIDVADIDEDKRTEALKQLIAKMSPEHRKLIAKIMLFLCKMVDYEDKTNMNAYNLAVVIAPNILVAPRESSLMEQLQDSVAANEVIMLMIEQANTLFA